MTKQVNDLLILAGLGIASVGMALVFIPAGLVVAGVGLAAFALVVAEVKP